MTDKQTTEPVESSGIKGNDKWLLGLLPVGLAGLLAILSFGLEHRRYMNLAVVLIGAAGLISTLVSRILPRRGPPLAKDTALIFGLIAGVIILFVQHLLFAGLLGPHR